MSSENSSMVEILTIEEFSDRLRVSERTVWHWIHSGRLKAGRHYIQFERVIRFAWGIELIKKLHDDSVEADIEHATEVLIPVATGRKRLKNALPPMDLNY